MDIGFTEEQELLRDTARRFLESECDTQFVRKRMAEPAAVTDEFWQKLAEQGWLGIVYPEEEGGSGLGLVDLVVLMEEMGRAVMPGPFLSTVLLGGAAIGEAGTQAQRRQWLTQIAAGKAKAALAWTEPNLRWDAAGITLRVLSTIDETRKLCEVRLDNVSLPAAALLGEKHAGWAPLSRVVARATVALAAEMCGGAQQVLDMTVAYAKIRIAFGKPIGSYQGVKHQAADMLVAIENAKSLTYYAAWAVDQRFEEAPIAVSMAKAAASDMARKVAGTGIQLHGGIGMTWEHDLQLYFKRAKASEVAFGDATWHRERVAQLMTP